MSGFFLNTRNMIWEKMCAFGRWIKEKIKKVLLWLGIITIATAATITTQDLTRNEISIDKIQEKYEQAEQIKTNYSLNEAELVRKNVKNSDLDKYTGEPKDEIQITIGDNTPVIKQGLLGGETETKEFKPNIELKRWNEVSFKIKTDELLKDIATNDKDLTFEDNKIKFDTPKISFEMYEDEDGFHYDKILNAKPESNQFVFSLEVSNLDFFFQPPLNEEMAGQDCWTNECTATSCCDAYRPDNVVNSWAVYHNSKGGLVDSYGKDYKSGKAFHIYRCKATDANGDWVWCDTNIDIKAGTITYVIDESWLESAKYPVRF